MTSDYARLRQIMYEPATVWLSTDLGGQRWLTDKFVLYDVTDYEELKDYDFHVCLGYPWHLGYEPIEGECSCPDEVPDGSYQLTVSKGFKPRESVPEPDIEAYFVKMNEKEWHPVKPSEWSVAEHPGKAMLWTHSSHQLGDDKALPCLIGEPTWKAIKRHHPNVLVEYTAEGNTFRFREVIHDGCDEESYCGCRPTLFAYAAGIRIPDGQETIANEIARLAA